jgi:hypothetical protein
MDEVQANICFGPESERSLNGAGKFGIYNCKDNISDSTQALMDRYERVYYEDSGMHDS